MFGTPRVFAWRAASRIGKECSAEVTEVGSFGQALRALSESEFRTWKRIGTEEDVLPVSFWRLLALTWPGAVMTDVSPLIRWQRAVKSETEIRYLREAARIMAEGYAEVAQHIRPGIPEILVQLELDRALRRRGHQGFLRMRSFNAEAMGLVASGESATVAGVFDGPVGESGVNPAAPSGAGASLIQPNSPILIDGGSVFNGYHADMTRIYVIGELIEKLQHAHEFCCELLETIAAKLVPGAIPRDIYEWTLAQVEKAGYSDVFMNSGPLKARFIGHGVGLELDEWPVITKSFTQPLEENMVLAIEPKIVFDEGAVGIEDTFLVTPRGGESITQMDRGVVRISKKTKRNLLS
jgi:Xaa-Pro aminopeptidase